MAKFERLTHDDYGSRWHSGRDPKRDIIEFLRVEGVVAKARGERQKPGLVFALKKPGAFSRSLRIASTMSGGRGAYGSFARGTASSSSVGIWSVITRSLYFW